MLTWVVELAQRAHAWARDERCLARFQEMIVEWADEGLSVVRLPEVAQRDYFDTICPDWRGDGGSLGECLRVTAEGCADDAPIVQDFPILLRPSGLTPLKSQYAAIAAIHDTACRCAGSVPLNPWAGHRVDPKLYRRVWADGRFGDEVLTDKALREAALPFLFAQLRPQVHGLTDADRGWVEATMDAVSADLLSRYGKKDAEGPGDQKPDLDLVTLNQLAGLVQRSKRTLENYLDKMPKPRIRGRGGKPSEWAWSELRPWAQGKFGRVLPEKFPAHVPAHRN